MNITPSFLRRRISSRPNLLKIVDNIGWLFLDKVLRMGAGLLVGVWLARYLGPEKFGLLNFAQAFTGLFGAIAALGLQGVVVRDIVVDSKTANLTLGAAGTLQLVSGFVSYFLTLAAIAYFRPDDEVARALVAILGATVLFKASEIAIYWFESQVESKYVVWVQGCVFVVFVVIKIVLILSGASLLDFAWAVLIEAACVSLLMVVVMNWRTHILRALKVSKERVKALLKDSWPLLLSAVAVSVYMKVDQIMLGQMAGDKAVGIYSVAVKISEIWYFIPVAIVASVFPAILEARKRSEAQYIERLQSLYNLMVLASVAVALPMSFIATPVVVVLFGEAYNEAGALLAAYIWASIFVSLGVASGKWFLAEGLQKLVLYRALLGAGINVGLNFWLIPVYGEMGATVATLISHAVADYFADYLHPKTKAMFSMKTRSLNVFRLLKA